MPRLTVRRRHRSQPPGVRGYRRAIATAVRRGWGHTFWRRCAPYSHYRQCRCRAPARHARYGTSHAQSVLRVLRVWTIGEEEVAHDQALLARYASAHSVQVGWNAGGPRSGEGPRAVAVQIGDTRMVPLSELASPLSHQFDPVDSAPRHWPGRWPAAQWKDSNPGLKRFRFPARRLTPAAARPECRVGRKVPAELVVTCLTLTATGIPTSLLACARRRRAASRRREQARVDRGLPAAANQYGLPHVAPRRATHPCWHAPRVPPSIVPRT